MLSVSVVSANVTIDAETNDIRTAHGLTTLETNGTLESIATQRAYEVATAWPVWDASLHPQWIYGAMGCIEWAGENLAHNNSGIGFTTQWFNSPVHRANMLYPTYDQQGSAVYYDENTGIYFAVQIFADTCAPNAGTGTSESTTTGGTIENSVEDRTTRSSATQEPVTKLPNTSAVTRGKNQ